MLDVVLFYPGDTDGMAITARNGEVKRKSTASLTLQNIFKRFTAIALLIQRMMPSTATVYYKMAHTLP